MSSGDDYDGSSDVSESDLDDVPLSMPSPERKGPGLPMMNRLQIDPMVSESSSSRDAQPVSLGDALATRLELQSGTVLTEEAKPALPNSESLTHHQPDAAETRPQSPPRSRGLRLIVERPAGGSPLSSPGALTTPESMRDIQTPDGVTDSASRISVELVSHAFTLDSRYLAKAKEKSLSTTEIVTQRCCRSLGVAQEEFQLFELRPLPAGAIPDGVEHVGVAVSKSGFSLHALEDLLVEHKRMAASMERTTSAMEVMQKSIRDKDQKVARLELKTAEHEADSRRWHDRCQSLESENQALRQQLQRSDRLRKQAQQGLMDIRAQFEDFARNYQAVQHHSDPIAHQTNGGVVLSAQQCHKMDVIALRVEDVYGMCEQLAGRLDRLERGPSAESKPS